MNEGPERYSKPVRFLAITALCVTAWIVFGLLVALSLSGISAVTSEMRP